MRARLWAGLPFGVRGNRPVFPAELRSRSGVYGRPVELGCGGLFGFEGFDVLEEGDPGRCTTEIGPRQGPHVWNKSKGSSKGSSVECADLSGKIKRARCGMVRGEQDGPNRNV